MNELTLALLAVLIFTLVYYGSAYGMNYVVHALTLLGASLATAFAIEFAWAKFYKKDVKKFFDASYEILTENFSHEMHLNKFKAIKQKLEEHAA